MANIRLENEATPATPPTGKTLLFVDSADKKLAIKDDAGLVSKFGVLVNDSVNNDILSNMPTKTYKGRTTAGTGDPEDLTVAQMQADLNIQQGVFAVGTATANTTLDFTSGINSSSNLYELLFWNVTMSVNGAALWLRTDGNGGASFDAGAGDYEYGGEAVDANGTTYGVASTGAAQMILARNIWNAAGSSASGMCRLWSPSIASTRSKIHVHSTYYNDLDEPEVFDLGGSRDATGIVNALRILPSSGTFSGSFAIRRVKTS